MPDDALKPALRAALRMHEIGNESPYRLFFAAKGKSGASFGFVQGDLAAGQPEVQRTFREVLTAAGVGHDVITDIARRLSVHLIANPLSPAETKQVNDALLAGRASVDAMDEAILAKIYAGVDTCIARAAQAGRSVAPKALLYMAMWINMTGPPSKLLVWLDGRDPQLRSAVAPPGNPVDVPAVEAYLLATDYYTENRRNFAHMQESAAAGALKLPA
jgi:hypothetical protein